MNKRLELHELLCEILGSRQVYFQAPPSKGMSYPAIIYSRSDIDNTFANNSVYKQARSYEIIVIDKNPDSEIVDKVSRIPRIRYDRPYKADNLNHDVFTLIY